MSLHLSSVPYKPVFFFRQFNNKTSNELDIRHTAMRKSVRSQCFDVVRTIECMPQTDDLWSKQVVIVAVPKCDAARANSNDKIQPVMAMRSNEQQHQKFPNEKLVRRSACAAHGIFSYTPSLRWWAVYLHSVWCDCAIHLPRTLPAGLKVPHAHPGQ